MTGTNSTKKIAIDKILHFCVCMLLAMSWGCMVIHIQRYKVIACGFLFAMIIGLLKELYDSMTGGKFDWEDIIADFVGAIMGSAFMFCVFYFV